MPEGPRSEGERTDEYHHRLHHRAGVHAVPAHQDRPDLSRVEGESRLYPPSRRAAGELYGFRLMTPEVQTELPPTRQSCELRLKVLAERRVSFSLA